MVRSNRELLRSRLLLGKDNGMFIPMGMCTSVTNVNKDFQYFQIQNEIIVTNVAATRPNNKSISYKLPGVASRIHDSTPEPTIRIQMKMSISPLVKKFSSALIKTNQIPRHLRVSCSLHRPDQLGDCNGAVTPRGRICGSERGDGVRGASRRWEREPEGESSAHAIKHSMIHQFRLQRFILTPRPHTNGTLRPNTNSAHFLLLLDTTYREELLRRYSCDNCRLLRWSCVPDWCCRIANTQHISILPSCFLRWPCRPLNFELNHWIIPFLLGADNLSVDTWWLRASNASQVRAPAP